MRKNNLTRIDSSAVQGPDSFVVLRSPTWKTMRKMMKAQANATNEVEIGLVTMEIVMPDLIVDWNWAKETEDGQLVRLPPPSQQASVMDELDFDEAMFLMNNVTPLLEAMKTRPN